MKLFFLRDNIDKNNWGCRATSAALRQTLASKHEISFGAGGGYLGRWYPHSEVIGNRAYESLCRYLDRQKLLRLPVVGSLVGKALDAVGERHGFGHDIAANVEVLQAYAGFDQRIAEMLKALDAADGLVINLEGDGIFPVEPRRHLLFTLTLCEIARRASKPIYFVNGMLSEDPRSGVNMETVEAARPYFEGARVLALREARSKEFADKYFPNARSVMVPDALFAWQAEFEKVAEAPSDRSVLWPYFDTSSYQVPAVITDHPFIAVGGSSAAAWDQRRAAPAYAKLIETLKRAGLPIVVIQACDGDAFLKQVAEAAGVAFVPVNIPVAGGAAILARAKLFVSGRWHPSIMAALAGTPSIFLGSNSHKTRSLQEQLGYPVVREYGAIPSEAECDAILTDAIAILAEGQGRRDAIVERARDLSAQAQALVELL